MVEHEWVVDICPAEGLANEDAEDVDGRCLELRKLWLADDRYQLKGLGLLDDGKRRKTRQVSMRLWRPNEWASRGRLRSLVLRDVTYIANLRALDVSL